MLRITLRLSLALTFAAMLTLSGLTRPRVAKAQADGGTSSFTIPLDLTLFAPCANGGAGEFVHVTGGVHIVSHLTLNDNHVTLRVHNQAQGISGVGLTTGDLYHMTGKTDSTATFQLDGEQNESTYLNRVRIVGQGPDNNFIFQEHGHATFNNNGELTVDHFTFSVECQ